MHTEEAYKALGSVQKCEGVDASIGDWHICKGLMEGTRFILVVAITERIYFDCLKVGCHISSEMNGNCTDSLQVSTISCQMYYERSNLILSQVDCSSSTLVLHATR